jgi:hypothetical protein
MFVVLMVLVSALLLLVVLALVVGPTRPAPSAPEIVPASTEGRVKTTAIILAVTAASLVYRAIVDHGLQQTAALFIGVPVILAIVVIFSTSPRSAVGVACKAVTVGMLLSALVFWEGVLCVLMAAPVFYLIAIVLTYGLDRAREHTHSRTLHSFLIVVIVAPMSLEGVTKYTTLNRRESVTATTIVHASSSDVERALFEAPRFDRTLPRYLRAGFPRPTASRIERGGTSLRWVIQLRGGETFLNGTEPQSGDLILELEERRSALLRWRAVSDTSHMTHFLTFREAIVTWESIDDRTTRVTWTIRYDRGLDPAWYFGPMERYATRLAAGYLIDAVATP